MMRAPAIACVSSCLRNEICALVRAHMCVRKITCAQISTNASHCGHTWMHVPVRVHPARPLREHLRE